MVEDFMKTYKPTWTDALKGFGVVFCVGAVYNLFIGEDSSAQICAIMGPGLIGAGYLGDLTAYAKIYFNERLNILKDKSEPSGLERKVK